MSYCKWNALYEAYKNNFDLELTLKTKGVKYKDLVPKQESKEEIIAF